VQSGKYRKQAGEWQLLRWQTAVPSRTKIAFPPTITEEISEARKIHHRFGQFTAALEEIRARVEAVPIEKRRSGEILAPRSQCRPISMSA